MAKSNKAVKNNVKVYTANNTVLLGSRIENVLTGISFNGGAVDFNLSAEFFKAQIMGELLVVECGANTDILTRELTRKEKLDYNYAEATFIEANEIAADHAVSLAFDDLIGKK